MGRPATSKSHPHTKRPDTPVARPSWIRADRPPDVEVESAWDARAAQWRRTAATPAFQGFRDAVLAELDEVEGQRVLDLGCGTGLLTIPIANRGGHALGLDASTEMLKLLRAQAGPVATSRVDLIHGDMRSLPLPDASVDAIVSCYAFHHLTDADKRVALAEVVRVLRPGGRLVVVDMMFRIGISRRNRRIVVSKVALLLRKGPAGVVRLLRNAGRYAARRWEHPAPIGWWERALTGVGFAEITVRPLAHEAGLAVAVRAGRAVAAPTADRRGG